MQRNARVFDDIARVANGAFSTLAGLKGEVEIMIRTQIERVVAELDVVPREEFDAVKAMAAKARTEQEKLEKRVAELEAAIAAKKPAAKPRAPRKKAAPKAE